MSSQVEIKKHIPGYLTSEGIESQLGFLSGDILTIIDSSIPPGPQNKAAKDLVKNAFRSRMHYVSELCNGTPSIRSMVANEIR